MSASIEFPNFLYGTFASLQRDTRKEGKRWAKHYRATGTFPAAPVKIVEPLSIVRTHIASDLERIVPDPHWRLYFVTLLGDAVSDIEEWGESYRAVYDEFEAHVRGFAWGALAVAVEHAYPNSIARVGARLDAVLAHWDELDTLRYIGPPAGPPPVRAVRLAELMAWHFERLCTMWLDAHTGDARRDLCAAADAMRAAPPEAVRARIVQNLARVASSDERTRRVPELADTAWLATRLAGLDAETLADLETGRHGLRQLFIWKPEARDL
jgi:hypothetical protein